MCNNVHKEGVTGDHIAGASCIWAAGMRGITPHGKAGTLALRPDGRRKEGRHGREKEYVKGKIEKKRCLKIDKQTVMGR